jgi:hypothetical protein
MKIFPLFLAALVTTVVVMIVRRYSSFVDNKFNTQAYVDPKSVPPRNLLNTADSTTIAVTQMVKPPMAQIASGFGEMLSLVRLNPVLPKETFANTRLDMPSKIYVPNRTG